MAIGRPGGLGDKRHDNFSSQLLTMVSDFKLFQPELILRIIGTIHILCAPLTKVEESFNLQATHDILFHKTQLNKYDHLEFPGVVPRTFIGPLILAILSSPIVIISEFFLTKFASQIIVRLCLGELVIRAFKKFRQSLSKEFGNSFGWWVVLITGSQFHFMYYIGRTLPNIFALPPALLALHYWMAGRHGMFILMASFDSLIFRSELVGLFGIILLYELGSRRLSVLKAIKYAIPSGLGFLALTIAIDSIFWQRWVWPEGEVLWFNTIRNQSHKWGTSPFLWYFYSALPRGLMSSLLLVPFSLWSNHRVRVLIIPCLLFVFLYSFLPHKELRFIIYVIPVLNVAAAATCDRIWKNRGKGFFPALLSVGILFHLVVNGVLSTGFLIVSRQNYPGGTALIQLHEIESGHAPVNVHIDVYSAQTGVSRFTEISSSWKYNKSEHLEVGGKEMMSFTHLLIGTMNVEERYAYFKSHEVAATIESFVRIEVQVLRYPPLRIKTESSVLILRRKDFHI